MPSGRQDEGREKFLEHTLQKPRATTSFRLRKHSGEDLPDESNINPADLAEEFLLDQVLQTPEGLRLRDDR